CLAPHEQGFLGDAVGRIGLFRVAVPQLGFTEWDGGVLGIAADGADLDEFLDLVNARAFDKLHTHHKVLVEESAGILLVGSNSADDGSQMYDNIGAGVAVKALDVFSADEVVVALTDHEHVFASHFTQPRDDPAPQEAGTPGYAYSLFIQPCLHNSLIP